MSIYEKENPAFLKESIAGILAQTIMPDEWIIVKDGPLTSELEAVIDAISFKNDLKIIALPENVTQGPARAEGIKTASHEWVAIIDSDDICLNDRFEKQLEYIEKNPQTGLLGGQIEEFLDDPDVVHAKRIVPLSNDEIKSFAKKRNPFNSMTVMLKREEALNAGNYAMFPWFEDYDLWVRMISNGTICANLPEVLVKARVGAGMYGRRRGFSYIRSEWKMQKQLKTLGMINNLEFARNFALRIPPRLLPEKALEKAYKKFAR